MKRIFLKTLIVLALLGILATPALAYGRVQGQVIDSKDLNGWIWGGEVWVYDSAGNICGTGGLDANGNIVSGSPSHIGIDIRLESTDPITPPDDDLGYWTGNCTGTVTILIDFTCSEGVYGCTPPLGIPATNTVDFVQNPLPVTYNAGFIRTGTGPNALELVEFSVAPQSNSNTWLPFVLLVGSVALVSGAVTVIRKRRA